MSVDWGQGKTKNRLDGGAAKSNKKARRTFVQRAFV